MKLLPALETKKSIIFVQKKGKKETKGKYDLLVET